MVMGRPSLARVPEKEVRANFPGKKNDSRKIPS
jgi:hypothetical protein